PEGTARLRKVVFSRENRRSLLLKDLRRAQANRRISGPGITQAKRGTRTCQEVKTESIAAMENCSPSATNTRAPGGRSAPAPVTATKRRRSRKSSLQI